MLRASGRTLRRLVTLDNLAIRGSLSTDEELEPEKTAEQTIVEVIIPSSSFLVGETLDSSTFRQRYDANVLAFRSRGETIRDRLEDLAIRAGDTLLIQADTNSIDRLAQNRDFILAHEADEPDYRTDKIPHAVAIMVGVVGFVATPWAFLGTMLASLTGVEQFTMLAAAQQDILITALAGVVAMVVAGVLKPNELYDSVDWDVIFLLAGVIPLGTALEQTSAALLLGRVVAASADFLPVILVLWVFYIATGLITEVISNNASVVLMIPVAAAAATAIRCKSIRVRSRGDVRGKYRLPWSSGLPDESLRLRSRWVQVHGLLPGRGTAPIASLGGHCHRNRYVVGPLMN